MHLIGRTPTRTWWIAQKPTRCYSTVASTWYSSTTYAQTHHPSPNSCKVEVTLRFTWLVKLSKTDRSLPSSQVNTISQKVPLATIEQQSIEQRSTGDSWPALTVAGSLFLRAARDQVLLWTCTNIVVEGYLGVAAAIDRPLICASTFRKVLAKMSTDRAPENVWCNVFREGMMFCRVGFEMRAKV